MSETPNEGSQLNGLRDEADMILFAAESAAKSSSWQRLRGEEQATIAAACDRLTLVKQREDMRAIREAIDALDEATRRIAELMMDAAVQSAIRGES
jgi:molecular chaperone DnaK